MYPVELHSEHSLRTCREPFSTSPQPIYSDVARERSSYDSTLCDCSPIACNPLRLCPRGFNISVACILPTRLSPNRDWILVSPASLLSGHEREAREVQWAQCIHPRFSALRFGEKCISSTCVVSVVRSRTERREDTRITTSVGYIACRSQLYSRLKEDYCIE